MERRKAAVWTGLVVTGLVVASCLLMAGNVTADPGSGMVEQGFKPQSEFQNPEEFRSSQGNNPGDGNLPSGIDAKPQQLNAGQTKPSGIKAWFIDHGKGLGLGLLEGAGIALGVVALGALGVLAAPVAGIAAVGALAGCAIYGAITGANRFNPWECAVNGIIGAVSAGLGATVAAGSKLLTTVVNSVGGGIASTAGYLLNDPNPTLGGALAAFGLGAGTAGLMTVGGEWLAKTQVYQKAANLLHIGTRATKAASAVGQSLDDASTRSVSTDGASMASEAVEATGTARTEVAERLGTVGQSPNAALDSAPVLKPVIDKTYTRPANFRDGMRDAVWESNKGTDGLVKDPLSGKAMDPNEPWDMGHKPGFEFRKHQASAAKRGITRKQFLDEYNNPDHYRPELPSSNRCHKGEDPSDDYLGP